MNVDGTTLVVLMLLVASCGALLIVVDRRWATGQAAPAHDEPRHARGRRLADVFTVAIWFGLTTGVLHLMLAFVNRYVRGQFLMVGPQIVWMAPLSYVLIFAAVAVLLGIVVLVSPRVVPLRLSIGGFAWLGFFGLLLPFHQLGRLASAALAAGVAVQVARVMARRAADWLRVMRRTSLSMAVVIAVLALASAGWRATAEWLTLRRLPAAHAGAPNVLLVVMDTVRAANLSLYGYDRPTTPELVRLAEDGATFDWAFSTGPWTLKSHATMFTGFYPSQIGGDFQRPVSPPGPTLAEIFRDRGYVTGGFVANLPYTSRESGLARGFVHYDDYDVTPRQAVLHSWIAHTPLFRSVVNIRSFRDIVETLRHASLDFEPDMFNDRTYGRASAGQINASFLDWQAAHGDRPFFAFLNYFDAHVTYRAPPSFAARFALPEKPNLGRYDGAIAYIDQEIGRLLEELRRRGVLDNTIVIITSDHGEQFGEHGLSLHANSLYLPSLHVPLLMRYPAQVGKGVRIQTSVTLRDLAATVIDLAGLSQHVRVPGVSLAARANQHDDAPGGSAIVAEVERVIRPEAEWPVFFGPMRAVLDEKFHYIRRGDGGEELYAYRTDPAETRDLSTTPEGQREIARFRAVLATIAER